MKFKKLILIPLLSSILFFSSKPLLVRAYNSDTYSDLGGDYEGDWGAYAPKRTDSSGLSGSVPSSDGDDINNNAINIGNYYRFTHWAGVSSYGDCRGWQFHAREWATSSMYNSSNYWLPDYYFDGSGTHEIPRNVFANDGVLDAATYNDGNPWGYSNGSSLNYMRWAIIWYKREKPTPTMTDIGVSNFSKYYSTGDKSLWATPSANGQFWCQAEDRYPQTYGNAIQREGAVRRGLIWITGTNGLDYFGYTDMNKNTKDTTFCCDDTKDKEWINLKEKVAGKKDEEWIKLKEKIVGMSNEESVTQ